MWSSWFRPARRRGDPTVLSDIAEIEDERRKRLVVNQQFVVDTLVGIIDRCKVDKPQYALTAAVHLGKHLGMWSDRRDKLPKRLDEMDSEEIRALLGNGYLNDGDHGPAPATSDDVVH